MVSLVRFFPGQPKLFRNTHGAGVPAQRRAEAGPPRSTEVHSSGSNPAGPAQRSGLGSRSRGHRTAPVQAPLSSARELQSRPRDPQGDTLTPEVVKTEGPAANSRHTPGAPQSLLGHTARTRGGNFEQGEAGVPAPCGLPRGGREPLARGDTGKAGVRPRPKPRTLPRSGSRPDGRFS